MLKIKSPIQIRCKAPMETMHRDFSEKIIGNYTIINSRMRKEELLYITTQAPEVYFAEGNSISILNDVNFENNQEIKLDMINNLINRILVSGTNNFSYQDSVYISSVLRKIGITDVNTFMKNVHRLQEEKKENNKLINIYEEQKNLLMSVFEQAQSDKASQEVKNEVNNEYHNRYYLHEEIYNRLDTANLYQEIQQFSQGLETDARRIYNAEVSISEQVSVARNFNLHNLKKEIFNLTQPINYYHANMYELADNEEFPVQTAHEKITSAILLNMVDDIYSLRINQIEKNNHNWYTLASALFQSADNTWKRYEAYHNENKQIRSDMYNTMVSVVENKKQENNIINNIIREMKNINVTDEYTEYETTNSVMQNIDKSDRKNYDVHQNKYERVNLGDVINQSEYTGYADNIRNNENYYNDTVDLNYLEEFNEIVNENANAEHISEITRQHLDEINRRNIENYRKIQEIEINRPYITNVEINKEKARADMLRAINNPQEVIMEYLQSQTDNSFEENNNRIDTEIVNLFTDETKEIFNQYLQQKKAQQSTFNNINENVHNVYNDSGYTETHVNIEHREYAETITDDDESNEKSVGVQPQNINNEINVNYSVNSKNFSDEEKKLYEQFFEQTGIQKPVSMMPVIEEGARIYNDADNIMFQNNQVIMEHKEYTENVTADDDSNEKVVGAQPQNINNEINVNYSVNSKNFSDEEKKLYEQFFEQTGTQKPVSMTPAIEEGARIYNDADNIMFQSNQVIMEHMDLFGPEKEALQTQYNEIPVKSSVKYEINEVIQKNIEQLRNYNENHLYSNFITEDTGAGVKLAGRLTYDELEPSKTSSPELQHFIMQSQNSEYVVQNTLNERTIMSSKVGLVHKVEEQIITEDLINTIRERTVDNRKEETVEHSTHNIVKNEKNIQETVNSVLINKQNNIEEIVQQNVQKQINRISDQVYGKIEKKLQTERKRRGY